MVSTERITTELGFYPEYTFEQGIEKTVEWYKKVYK
jgi:dTDP-D-glucose 4,6-dehydratase